MTMLGKLVDGKLVKPPKEIIENRPRKVAESYVTEDGEEVTSEYTIEESVRYVGMTDAFLIEHGYYPIITTEKPDDDHEYFESYIQDGEVIRQVWEKGDRIVPERTIDDRLSTLETTVDFLLLN